MTSHEIRKRFLQFFKARGHKIVPSSSLMPTDPSVLLTTAGMQQFKPYFTEKNDPEKDFGTRRTASIQKCFRTSDIDEVGDESHLTFFEMLGNFSFGPVGSDNPNDFGKTGYFKRSAIFWAHEFITKELGLAIDYVTIFGGGKSRGSNEVPYDEESEKIWQELGVKDIHTAGIEDNFWGPTGNEGPCGPTTEIYAGGIEIWNIVFNEYFCDARDNLEKLKNPGVDTGMGLERLAMVMQKKNNVFETELFKFAPLLRGGNDEITRRARIVADHLRASVFLLADGVGPSNKEAGYILRRLLRRLLMQWKKLLLPSDHLEERLKQVIEEYKNFYPELKREQEKILYEFKVEKDKFSQALERGLKEFYKMYPEMKVQDMEPGQFHQIKRIFGKDAFYFYQTFGLTSEIIKDLARDGGHIFEEEEFDREFKKHQEISRAGAQKKFGGHGFKEGGEVSEKIKRLHTATHLLQAALKRILGPEVSQKGSDITEERTRFDFNFPRKLTPEEVKKTEEFVNDMIKKDLNVIMEEMAYAEAAEKNAIFLPGAKYPPRVTVYSIIDRQNGEETVISREICGGPHVKRTGEIGKFRITKEEPVSEGARRIRAVIE